MPFIKYTKPYHNISKHHHKPHPRLLEDPYEFFATKSYHNQEEHPKQFVGFSLKANVVPLFAIDPVKPRQRKNQIS